MGIWIRIGAAVVAVALGVSMLVAWRDARMQQASLQAELKSTQQALADATARQTSRDAALGTLLAQLKKSKAEVQNPEQVIAALPQVLPLPQAITLDGGTMAGSNGAGSAGESTAPGSGSKAPATVGGRYNGKDAAGGAGNSASAEFPAADLKPLYDFAVDCKSCQAQLAAARGDLKDEQAKEQALGRERDDALRAAKGGSVLRRVARAAKWFAIGAAAGAIAAKAAR